MSTYKVNNLRKRRSDDESSDSDEEIPPMKKRRSGGTNIKDSVSQRCNKLLKWLGTLPDHIKKQRMIRLSPENEMDVIEIRDDGDIEHPDFICDKDNVVINEMPAAFKKEVCNNIRGSGLPNGFPKPRNTSTPFYRDGTMVGYKHLSSATNGYHSKNPKTKDSLRKPQKQPKSYASPLMDVEFLQELPRAANCAELEIVADISRNGCSSKPSKPGMSPITRFDDVSYIGTSNTSQKSDLNGTFKKIYHVDAGKEETVNEVYRLDEKAQYEQMLEKIYASSTYYPKVKQTKKTIQIDLTQDEDSPFASPFHREFMEKPVDDFIEKYRKSAQLVPLSQASSTQPKKAFGANEDKKETKAVALPEYKPKKLTDPNFFNPSWIKELQTAIEEETENRMRIVRQQEDKIKRYQERRDAKIAKEKELLEKYKVPADVFPEEEEADPDFLPALTPEMEARIRNAVQDIVGRHLETMCSKFEIDILRKHMVTLDAKNWLIDEVLNFYLNLIMERSKSDDKLPTVYVYSTFFYTTIKRRGIQGVLRWTRKIDIFSYDLLIIPFHLDVHWALCVVDNRSKIISYYDSMGSNHSTNIIKPIHDYLILEKKSKKNLIMDPSEYKMEVVNKLPKQQNGSDCGMFALKYAEYISRDAEITFQQVHMDYFRKRMVYEILTQQLM